MRHRYLDPGWWAHRLAVPAERVLPAPWVMSGLALVDSFAGEAELRKLKSLVRRDAIAVDVGAAEGVYAWHLARIAPRCIAFEANPDSVVRLRARLPHVEVHNAALSDSCGEVAMRIPLGNGMPLTGLATIEKENQLSGHPSVRTVNVPCRTLDSFELTSLGFIKIDVEGHELSVLRGAEHAILRYHPTLLIEIEDRHRSNAVASVSSWLSERGYEPASCAGSPQNFLFQHR